MSIRGTCADFCPAAERAERLRCGRVHALEQGAGFPLVKCFARSAAGRTTAAAECRPEAVLCAVVAHLLGGVLRHPALPLGDDFVADRLRAVRADGFVQGLRSLPWCEALVRQVRYHLAVGYLLGGLSLGAGSGSALDLHSNAERTGEALGMARGALDALLRDGGGGAGAGAGGAGQERALALALEVQGYALVLALGPTQQPGAVQSALAQGAALARAAPPAARAAWRSVLLPCLAWVGGRWPEFLRGAAALAPGVGGRAPAALFARCALHRLLPHARHHLLQALNDALGTPAQPPTLPLAALGAALGFRDGGAARGAGGAAAAEAAEPAWFRAARFAAQLGLEVREGAAPCPASRLFELRQAWEGAARGEEEGGGSAQASVRALGCVLNKATRLHVAAGAGSGGGGEGSERAREQALRAHVALAPLREDEGVLPEHACGARTAAPLAELIQL
jgi:hypothetical protein